MFSNRRKRISILICLTVLCLCFPASARYVCGKCGDNLDWVMEDEDSGQLKISGAGQMTSAPWDHYKVTSVIIDEGATSLCKNAFSSCGKMTSVSLPHSLTEIGYGAFNGCLHLPVLSIPENVNSIGDYAFRYCSGLTGVLTLPRGLTSIGKGTFTRCLSLTGITIPNGVTSIGEQAFYECDGLTGITIPDSVTAIGNSAFAACGSAKSLSISKNLTTVGVGVFAGCKSLTSVTIPGSLTSTGHTMFQSCSGLTSVNIPNSITTISYATFAHCTSLPGITLPDSVTKIERHAFYNCAKLKSITLPKSVTSIGAYAFSNDVKLADVYYGGTEADREKIVIEDESSNEPLLNAKWHYAGDPKPDPASVVVKGGKYVLNAKGSAAVFTGPEKKSAKALVIQDKVKIGKKTYKVTEIAAGACKGMNKLTALTIGKNVTTIGKEAFWKCGKARSITILGTSLKKIGKNAFGKGYGKPVVTCPKKKVKAYTKLLNTAGLSKKSRIVGK